MGVQVSKRRRSASAFTLVELLVVISIISLLISILLPSLSQAREQAKCTHCLARLKDIGTALAAYENQNQDALPPARWRVTGQTDYEGQEFPSCPDCIEYGWAELLFSYVYQEPVRVAQDYPVLRNIEGDRWEEYFLCRTVGDTGVTSGHYRVYLPAWAAGSYDILANGQYGLDTHASPDYSGRRDRIRPKLPLLGDANDRSERGDGLGDDDCSYIDAGEANYAGSDGAYNGNRFSARHSGGANYLFQDLHATRSTRLRLDLARDFDLNGIEDVQIVP
ncbi:MAG TPA: prepilin-type N-terminal cleavage/methylation domain-containing protein [Phycisphaerae bacterium]|nr:prepilin-type N-terminal cleavage/methylation domain-containing protein [Phycisphaerae bacterium]HNU45733.1 prepilin-type N-terminal cleavage/methylation domain-containing protein [Phycisphaerae bacterium]